MTTEPGMRPLHGCDLEGEFEEAASIAVPLRLAIEIMKKLDVKWQVQTDPQPGEIRYSEEPDFPA